MQEFEDLKLKTDLPLLKNIKIALDWFFCNLGSNKWLMPQYVDPKTIPI